MAFIHYVPADQVSPEDRVADPDSIIQLRAAGYDDRAIHDACAIVSYFAFVNRIADGLGVQLETPADPG